MGTHHVLDALAVLPHLPPGDRLRLLDVGSGGGVPGIPLAIARPSWQVVLLDASQKKGAFLQQATIELGLANVQCRHGARRRLRAGRALRRRHFARVLRPRDVRACGRAAARAREDGSAR